MRAIRVDTVWHFSHVDGIPPEPGDIRQSATKNTD
jgi:hypothetical protein